MTSVLRRKRNPLTEDRHARTQTRRRWLCDSGDWGDAPTSQGLLANKQARKDRRDPPCGCERGQGPADTSVGLLASRTMAEYMAVYLFNRRLLTCGTHLLRHL